MEKLKIKLSDGKELIAEVNRYGADDEVELAIYIMDDTDKRNIEFQDICLVRAGVNNTVECLVWADKDNEDYTDYFTIEKFKEEQKMVTRAWKVYGAEGHRQRESFNPSYKDDFSNEKVGIRIIEVLNSDITGTNDYSIVKITRETAEQCESELNGQISDGIFENSRTGKIEEVVL